MSEAGTSITAWSLDRYEQPHADITEAAFRDMYSTLEYHGEGLA